MITAAGRPGSPDWVQILPRDGAMAPVHPHLRSPAVRLAALAPMGGLVLAIAWSAAAVAADNSRRFPGHREAGGSRDLCQSRRLAHLVPLNGRFAPGPSRQIALLEGESPDPRPLRLRLDSIGTWTLVARPVGVRLLTVPAIARPVLWESFPLCSETGEEGGLSGAPPARTLLEPRPAADEGAMRSELQRLSRSCGGSVPSAELLRVFAFEHLSDQLPARLSVHCETLPLVAGPAPSSSSQMSSAADRPASTALPQGFHTP